MKFIVLKILIVTPIWYNFFFFNKGVLLSLLSIYPIYIQHFLNYSAAVSTRFSWTGANNQRRPVNFNPTGKKNVTVCGQPRQRKMFEVVPCFSNYHFFSDLCRGRAKIEQTGMWSGLHVLVILMDSLVKFFVQFEWL